MYQSTKLTLMPLLPVFCICETVDQGHVFPIELIRNQQSTAADYFAVALHHFGDIRFNCVHKLILTHFLVNAYIPLSHLWIPSFRSQSDTKTSAHGGGTARDSDGFVCLHQISLKKYIFQVIAKKQVSKHIHTILVQKLGWWRY